MNDLDMIKELRPGAALPELGELGAARGLLTAAISAERSGGVSPAQSPEAPAAAAGRRVPASGEPAQGRPAARRLALATAALVALPGHRAPSASGPAAVPSRSGPAPAPSGALPPVTGHATAPSVEAPVAAGVNPAAAHLLRHAALAALRLPAGAPRPGQFVYTESEGSNGVRYQLWLSANGKKDGLARSPGRTFVIRPCTATQTQAGICASPPGYYPGMPADPRVLLAYLRTVDITGTESAGGAGWRSNDIAKGISDLMASTYLLPGQRAALYELMAQTPGFAVARSARDAIGRTGVAVEWSFMGSRAGEIILDPRTYAYLGTRTFPSPSFHGPGAHAYDGDALIQLAVVNKAGELP
jgi:hypothetical protein